MQRIVLVLALVVAGCNAPTATPVMHTVTGSFVLSSADGSAIAASGGVCVGYGGYSDIGPGTTAVLKDESGTILASGSLSGGKGTKTECTFPFLLMGVSDSAKFYSVEVGRRGAITKSHAEMVADGWAFGVTLGH